MSEYDSQYVVCFPQKVPQSILHLLEVKFKIGHLIIGYTWIGQNCIIFSSEQIIAFYMYGKRICIKLSNKLPGL